MLEHLQSQPDPHFQLVLTGCLATDSGVWTQVLPRRFPMTTMDRDSFAAVLRARFGLPSFHKETKCENCNQLCDVFGVHLATCKTIHSHQHNTLRNFLYGEARRGGLQPRMEVTNILNDGSGDRDRPADILIPVMPNLKAACIDVSVVNSFTQTNLATSKAGFNAERMAVVKKGKYEARCREMGYDFIPLIMESSGGFNKGADIVFKAIGRAISEIDRVEVPVAISRLKQRYSFAWQTMMGSAIVSQLRNGWYG